MEIWKDIPNYEGIYQVSNLGRVKSLERKSKYRNGFRLIKEKFLKLIKGKRGYLRVSLRKDGVLKIKKVHQLVAMSFLNHKPCGHTLVVDHINANKLDNRLCNLQLISQRKNSTKENRGFSKYVGVGYHKSAKKWRARIRINGKQKYLGLFKNELDAANAYQEALKKFNTWN